jgi:transcriptional regulator with XRE-family HTH domain
VPKLSVVIARNVRGERAKANLTQEQLAERVGWSRAVGGYVEQENRPVTVDELPRLARALGIKVIDLLNGADPEDLAPFL